MYNKILTVEDFNKNFTFHENDTGGDIGYEKNSMEYYLFLQVFLPIDFFNVKEKLGFLNSLIFNQANFSERIKLKLELFGEGKIDNAKAYIFKPWVMNIDDSRLYYLFEDFFLFIPEKLFYHIVARLVFLNFLNPVDFKNIRILQDLDTKEFYKFGIDKKNIPRVIKSDRLEMIKVSDSDIDKVEIIDFFSKNEYELTDLVKSKYFTRNDNTWFKITIAFKERKFFGLINSKKHIIIGYIRLYNRPSQLTDGFFVEYVIKKEYRNKKYGKEAVKALLSYLGRYSFAMSLYAEVNDENLFSAQLLRRVGFIQKERDQIDNSNYKISLLDDLLDMEKRNEKNETLNIILDKYVKKYSRYF